MTIDEKRFSDIEQAITHQDQQIQDLSDMVSEQWQEIDGLKKRLSHAAARLKSLENPDEDSNITDEKPPHY